MFPYSEERRLIWIGSLLGAAILATLLAPPFFSGGHQVATETRSEQTATP
jgi:hypothetical protein